MADTYDRDAITRERQAQADILYERLEARYRDIKAALDNGEDVRSAEDAWIALLNDYERLCNQLQNISRN